MSLVVCYVKKLELFTQKKRKPTFVSPNTDVDISQTIGPLLYMLKHLLLESIALGVLTISRALQTMYKCSL